MVLFFFFLANLTLSKNYPTMLASKAISNLNFVFQSIANNDNY